MVTRRAFHGPRAKKNTHTHRHAGRSTRSDVSGRFYPVALLITAGPRCAPLGRTEAERSCALDPGLRGAGGGEEAERYDGAVRGAETPLLPPTSITISLPYD